MAPRATYKSIYKKSIYKSITRCLKIHCGKTFVAIPIFSTPACWERHFASKNTWISQKSAILRPPWPDLHEKSTYTKLNTKLLHKYLYLSVVSSLLFIFFLTTRLGINSEYCHQNSSAIDLTNWCKHNKSFERVLIIDCFTRLIRVHENNNSCTQYVQRILRNKQVLCIFTRMMIKFFCWNHGCFPS